MNIVSKSIENYIDEQSNEQDPVLQDLLRETHLKVLMPHMCSGPVQGQLLYLLAKMIRAKNILEIGTFTGYATICMAKALDETGCVDTIDINKELQELCQKYFARSGQERKITMHMGSAIDLIPKMKKQYDLVFIDAHKQEYGLYYDLVFDQVNAGGLIIADNVLWKGDVALAKRSRDADAMHQYNSKIKQDSRVESIILSVRDGLNIARKK